MFGSILKDALSQARYFGRFWLSILRYRYYLRQAVARDVRKRYKRSVMGYFWSMLNPLLMMLILTAVFSAIMKRPAKDYAVFLLCGLLPWEFFSSTISQSLSAIRAHMNIILQVPVPKYIFLLAIAISNLTTFMLSLGALLLVMIITGAPFYWSMLALPLVLLPLFIFAVGMCTLFAVANVFFEDTTHLTGVILRGMYFLCPIIYSRDRLPENLVRWLALNPIFEQIEFMHGLFGAGALPDTQVYLVNVGVSLAVLYAGLWVFRRAEDKFIYFM